MTDSEHQPDQNLLPEFPSGLGVVLETTKKDIVVGSMEITPAHNNRNGVLHGGAIMAFADTLAGVAAAINLGEGESTTTIESKTNFIRSVQIGDRIAGRCVAMHKGQKTSIWQTIVTRSDGKQVAITTQTQMNLVWLSKS